MQIMVDLAVILVVRHELFAASRVGMLALGLALGGVAVYTVATRDAKDGYIGVVLLALASVLAFLRARRWV